MQKIKKVEQINRPLIVGEILLVPCFISVGKITPIVKHLHNDVENGQCMPHYHADYRFIDFLNAQFFKKDGYTYMVEDINRIDANNRIDYFEMPVIRAQHGGVTPVDCISKSKLKHKCIYKGKCPHRGFDLSQVAAVNGTITCPLHGLQFNAQSKQLLNDPTLVTDSK